LEPDTRYGHSFLEGTRDALQVLRVALRNGKDKV
jgi:hypothetical protein